MDWGEIAVTLARYIAIPIIVIGLAQNILHTVHLALAWRALARRAPPRPRRPVLPGERAPISLLVPAFNESAGVVESVRSMLNLRYPQHEVVVINDGSSDATLQCLIDAFELEPSRINPSSDVSSQPIRGIYESPRYSNLLVVDKQNGGKADALNAGIAVARYGLFCTVDADSILEPQSLHAAVEPFVLDPLRVVATGGTVRVANGCVVEGGRIVEYQLPEEWIPRFQTLEYVRAFLMARLGWSELGALLLISGAFGVFRRDVAVLVGGYSTDTVGEDLELVVKMHRHLIESKIDYRVEYVPDAVCWTEVPTDLTSLGKQRKRWHRGALETFFRHGDMMLESRYGRTGLGGFANALLVDVIGPLTELVGYLLIPCMILLGILEPAYLLAFVAVTFVYGIFLSAFALVLEEVELKRVERASDLRKLALVSVVENFGYRQLNTIWRVQGWWQFMRGRTAWDVQTRKGFKPRSLSGDADSR